MEYKEFEVKEELPPKKFKKHPLLSIVLISISIVLVIVAVLLTFFTGMEQLYTCFYAASLLTFILGFNSVLKFKGFCLILYPIIVLYSIISAYAFGNNKTILEFQFPIIAASVNGIYFIQSLYETIKKKNFRYIIVSSIILIATVVFLALWNVMSLNLIGTIISGLILAPMAYELISVIYHKKYDEPLEETTNNTEETTNEDNENEKEEL